MFRNSVCLTSGWLVAAFVAFGPNCQPARAEQTAPAAQAERKQPNVILILADDLARQVAPARPQLESAATSRETKSVMATRMCFLFRT